MKRSISRALRVSLTNSNKAQASKDLLLLLILAGHAILITPLSFLTPHAIDSLPALVWLIICVASVRLQPGTLLSRSILAVGLILYSATLIHISNGLVEMHFHIFVALALLSIYYGKAPLARYWVGGWYLGSHRKPGYFFPGQKLLLSFGAIIRGIHLMPLWPKMLADWTMG